jgi:hypothetical protein
MLKLQRTVGNQAVTRMLGTNQIPATSASVWPFDKAAYMDPRDFARQAQLSLDPAPPARAGPGHAWQGPATASDAVGEVSDRLSALVSASFARTSPDTLGTAYMEGVGEGLVLHAIAMVKSAAQSSLDPVGQAVRIYTETKKAVQAREKDGEGTVRAWVNALNPAMPFVEELVKGKRNANAIAGEALAASRAGHPQRAIALAREAGRHAAGGGVAVASTFAMGAGAGEAIAKVAGVAPAVPESLEVTPNMPPVTEVPGVTPNMPPVTEVPGLTPNMPPATEVPGLTPNMPPATELPVPATNAPSPGVPIPRTPVSGMAAGEAGTGGGMLATAPRSAPIPMVESAVRPGPVPPRPLSPQSGAGAVQEPGALQKSAWPKPSDLPPDAEMPWIDSLADVPAGPEEATGPAVPAKIASPASTLGQSTAPGSLRPSAVPLAAAGLAGAAASHTLSPAPSGPAMELPPEAKGPPVAEQDRPAPFSAPAPSQQPSWSFPSLLSRRLPLVAPSAREASEPLEAAVPSKAPVPWVARSTWGARRGYARRLRDSSDPILSKLKDHLLNAEGEFKSPYGKTHDELINNPDLLEMMHLESRKGGGERVVVGSAWINQLDRITVERPRSRMSIKNVAVNIGGILFEVRSAQYFESLGWLDKGTVANAPRVTL